MKLPVIIAALLSGMTAASAADLAPAPVEPIAPAAPAFSWAGFYVGAHAGAGWGRDRDNQSEICGGGGNGASSCGSGGGSSGSLDRFNLQGFVGGIHAGYNFHEAERFVVGAEMDFDYANLHGSAHGYYNSSYRVLGLRSRWQGSGRLRLGYAVDRFLPYITAGVAIAEGRLTNAGTNNGKAIQATGSSKMHLGWTVGLGSEYAFTDHWIGRAELRYTDFPKGASHRTADGPVKAGWDQVTATIGLSYRF